MNAFLGDLADIRGGGTPNKSNPEFWGGNIPWASVKDFKSTELESTTDYITKLGVEKSATNIIPAGNIIVPTRMALGKVAINKVDMAINQDLKALIIKDERILFKQYLLRFLESKAKFIEEKGKGATVKGITLDILKAIEIPLPPLTEQKRIAAILDKADAIRRKRQQANQLADEFLRAVFLDMFGDPVTNPKGWEVKSLEQIAAKERYAIKAGPFGSALRKEDYVPKGYKIYGQEQVIRDDLAYGDYYIDEKKYRTLEACSVKQGDLLISLVGTFGKIAVVPNGHEPGIINPRLMKISIDEFQADPRFVKFLLSTPGVLAKISQRSHGGTMGIVNVGIMKELDLPVPPVYLQRKFIKVFEKVGSIAGAGERFMKFPLLDSLSQKGFIGEL